MSDKLQFVEVPPVALRGFNDKLMVFEN